MAAMLDQYLEAPRTGDYEAAAEVFDVEMVSADTIVFFHRDGEETLVNAVRFGDFSLDEGHIERHLVASA